MWLNMWINSGASDYANLKYIIEHGTPQAEHLINDPTRKGYFTLFWKDIEMGWVMDFLSKVMNSRAVVSATIQDDAMVVIQDGDGLQFASQDGSWICTHPDTPRVIGTGSSQQAAFNDYHNRFKNGWYEVKLERLITAMKAGIAARQLAVDASVADQKQILQDTTDLLDFVRIVRSGNFIIVEDKDGSGT